MRKMKLGQYISGTSIIHQLDPRTKLLGGFAMVMSILVNSNCSVLIPDMVLILAIIYLAKIDLKSVANGVKCLWVIFVLSFVAQCIYTGGSPLLSLGPVIVTKEGVYRGIATFLRLLILYLSTTILTMTTSPMKLAGGLESLFAPLNRFKVPVNQFAMLITISLRFIPTLLEEAETISRAQKSRGAPLESPQKILRFKASLAVLIPLVAGSLQRATDLAAAMESRCYTGGPHHSRTKNLHFGSQDVMAMAFTALFYLLPLIYNYGWH